MTLLSAAQVAQAVKRLAEENPDKTNSNACVYFLDDGASSDKWHPDCIVGHALTALGVTPGDVGYNTIAARSWFSPSLYDDPIEDHDYPVQAPETDSAAWAWEWVIAVQDKADRSTLAGRATWSEAAELAGVLEA